MKHETQISREEMIHQDDQGEKRTGGRAEIKIAPLRQVAPAQAARLSFQPQDIVWQLNLDQVEAQSGRILSKVTGFASAAGTSTQPFDTGNVLYSKLRPYLNKVVCPDAPGIATTELVPLRPDPKKLDRQYLTYYLRSPEFVTWISNEVAGAKMPRVTMKVFWDHEIPLPPLAEQKRIAAILDAADALRTKRRESLAQLDALLQSTFLTLFGDPVANPIHPTKCVAEIVSRIIDYRGKSPEKTTEGIPLITAKIVKKKGVDEPNEFIAEKAYDSWMRRGIPSPQDVIITTEAPMGEVALVPDYKAAFAQRLLVLQPKREILEPIYLMWALTMPFVTRQMDQRATGSTVTGIRSKEFRKVEVPLPPLPLQQKFAAIVESVERQKAAQRAHLAELDALFAALQHRAFRGEL